VYGRGGGGYGRGPSGPGFGGGLALTPMVRNIIIANVVVYIFTLQSPYLVDLLLLDGYGFRPWQPFTYMWLHDTQRVFHILMNMLGLFMFGCDLERVWGPQRFLRFYLLCGVGAGFLIWIADLVFGPNRTLGASGAVYGVMTAYSLSWPNRTIQLLIPPIPIRAVYLIPVLFLMQLSMGGNVSHVGHLGGVIMAVIDMRQTLGGQFRMRSLRYQWNRWVMRNRLRAVRRDDWQRQQRRPGRDDDDHPTIH
jgi:membrane associated rhomboid family serine protease